MIAGVGPPSGTSRRSRVRAAIAIGIAVLALVASVASLATWAATPLDLVTFVTLPLAFGGVGAALGMMPVFWAMAATLAGGGALANRHRRSQRAGLS